MPPAMRHGAAPVMSRASTLRRGDLVVMPFAYSDGTCEFCHEGLNTACVHVGFFGNGGFNGAQAEALRVPLADADEPPLRWVAGDDVVEGVESKARLLLAQVDAHRELSMSLAHEDAKVAA